MLQQKKMMCFFLFGFILSGLIVVTAGNSYFKDFWEIADCNSDRYKINDYMYQCKALTNPLTYYSVGSIIYGIEKEAKKNLLSTDILVIGNSRTRRSFSTDSIDAYLQSKHKKYFVLSSLSANYSVFLDVVNEFDFSPPIILVNNEIFYSNRPSKALNEFRMFPEKYKTRYHFFSMAQTLQKKICDSDMSLLSSIYCEGESESQWRSSITGRLGWSYIAPDEKQNIIRIDADSRMGKYDYYMNNAKVFFANQKIKNSCVILYLVQSPGSSPDLMFKMADELKVPAVFVEVPGLKTYDNSHLDRPNSEVWSEAFVKKLDLALDNCISGLKE